MAYKDPEKEREYQREYGLRNRERLREYGREYRARNIECMRELERERRVRNIEQIQKCGREWYHRNKEHVREYCIRNRERISKRNSELRFRRLAENPDYVARERLKCRESQERQRGAYPEKLKARKAVVYAVSTGRLLRPETCSSCEKKPELFRDGRSAIQGHHHDYARLLDVVWLCCKCHALAHIEDKLGFIEP